MFRCSLKPLPVLLLVALAGLALAAAAMSSNPEQATVIEPALQTTPAAPPMTAGERVLAGIREEGRAQVRAIALEMQATDDPEQRRALQLRASEIKQQTRLRFLETLAAQSLERGDLDRHTEAMRQIQNTLNPPLRDYGPPAPEALRKMKLARGEQP
jgi:hypothetical protein